MLAVPYKRPIGLFLYHIFSPALFYANSVIERIVVRRLLSTTKICQVVVVCRRMIANRWIRAF